ncbi:ATP-binding protein [Streptomyces sp. NPDC057654]|uniref:ATP-binding protein n=1 Tax=Streptomyces sp. NPDC057654 TaxID=3346196 RepID=UPI0036901345
MDPMDRGPEDHEGRDGDGRRDGRTPADGAASQAPGHERGTPGSGGGAPGLARTVQLVAGDYLLTINPVDGSEIEVCRPADRPGRPEKHLPEERAELRRAAAPPPLDATAGSELPFLGREEERERLVRLLGRGRSVRLTGPPGAGRTSLLDAVAEDCADLAPDGVVRLSGYRRTSTDLLYDLFAAVHRAPLHRPDRDQLAALVADIGAVVVLDDLEFGGAALDDLLDATPECAFLIAATPDVAAPSADSHLEEVFLGGLGRDAWLELLARAVRRPPAADEAGWASDLWFESEGLPLRYVQAGALLRQRDELRADPGSFDEYGVFAERPVDAPFDGGDPHDVPLPSTTEAAEPAALIASRVSEAGRATLRLAVALGGELPHQAHLPALVGDAHADAALGELIACGLVTPAGAHYRLAGGVLGRLQAAGYGTDAATHAQLAAQHYAWWAGHPSVTPERTAIESDAILAAMGVLVAGRETGHPAAAVLLARTVAPAFAAALHWSAWERSLRFGQEAARIAGEVAEEAYFHHELGILALCTGNLDRARAELEASIGLRGVLADRRGTVAGRRALALVADRTGRPAAVPPPAPDGYTPAGEEVPDAQSEESASPPGGVSAPFAAGPDDNTTTIITRLAADGGAGAGPVPGPGPGKAAPPPPARKAVLGGARRNLVAAGAGALLVAVLGTVVTLGATSGDDKGPSDKVKPGQSASQQDGDGGLTADQPGGGKNNPGGVPGHQGTTGHPGPTTSPDSPSDSPSPSDSSSPDDPTHSGEPSHTPSSPSKPTDDPTEPTHSPTHKPTTAPTHTPTHKPTTTPTGDPDPTGPTTPPESPPTGPTSSQTVTQSTSQSASQSAPGSSQTQSDTGAPTSSRTA